MKSLLYPSVSLLLLTLASSTVRAQPAAPVPFAAKGAPFSAEAVEEETYTRPDGYAMRRSWMSKIFRDSKGRLRFENENDHGASIAIFDPVRQVHILLFPASKIANVTKLSPEWGPPMSSPVASTAPDYKREDLGSKEIEGYSASGTRASGTGRDGLWLWEHWFSSDLRITLLSALEHPRGKSTNRVFNIRLGDPDPSVFEIPEGYSVKQIKTRE